MCLGPRLDLRPATPATPTRPRAAFIGCGSSSLALLMNDPSHTELVEAYDKVAAMLDPENLPRAVVVVSPDWQTQEVVVTSAAHPSFQGDYAELHTEYGGLPCPPGSPEVAAQIVKLLSDGGIGCTADQQASFVDAVAGPTTLMFPEADVPVVSMSVLASLSTEDHVRIGTLLQPLCDENVLFLGLGFSSNVDVLQVAQDPLTSTAVQAFKEHLDLTVTGHRGGEIGRALMGWKRLPGADFNHPTGEHMMPLLVVSATAGNTKATQIDASFLGLPISNYVFD